MTDPQGHVADVFCDREQNAHDFAKLDEVTQARLLDSLGNSGCRDRRAAEGADARTGGRRLPAPRGHLTRMGGAWHDLPGATPGADADAAQTALDGRARGSGCPAGRQN